MHSQPDKLRQQIVFEAARLMFQRQEQEYARAKVRAARRVCRQRLRPSQLPTNREIREELQRLSGVYDAPAPTEETEGVATPAVEGEGRLKHFRNLLVPLAKISQDRRRHPEGDVLYHSLQVFRLACDALPYDEDFLLAALLHDVGKGIDPKEPVPAGLAILGDSISERTTWLIENLALAKSLLRGTIGIRARRRLQRSDDYDELLLLAKCDADGRVPGAPVPELDQALDFLRKLDQSNEADER